MRKKLYETPHVNIMEVETVIPIATSFTPNGDGVQSDLGSINDDTEVSPDVIRSSSYFNVWEDEY